MRKQLKNIIPIHSKPRITLYFLFFFLPLTSLYSQVNQDSLNQFIKSINQIYGVHDILVNGYPYISSDSGIKGHPFFKNNEWLEATIYIDDKKFENKKVKYNIREDDLVLKAKFGEDNFKPIQLNKFLIDSFKIDNHIFVNSSNYQSNTEKIVFYEKIYNNGETFIRHFNKNFISIYSSLTPQGRFSKTQESRYIIKNNTIEKVNNKRSFIRYFPKNKRKKIREYFRKEDINYSNATIAELKKLSNYSFRKAYE